MQDISPTYRARITPTVNPAIIESIAYENLINLMFIVYHGISVRFDAHNIEADPLFSFFVSHLLHEMLKHLFVAVNEVASLIYTYNAFI